MELFNPSLEAEAEYVYLKRSHEYLDLAICPQLEQNMKYLHYIIYRNLILKNNECMRKLKRSKYSKISDPNFNCELRLTYITDALNRTKKLLKVMSRITNELVCPTYKSGTRDDSALFPDSIIDYFQPLFVGTHSIRTRAIECNRPLRLRKLAFNTCVDKIIETERVFEHDARISRIFNTEFVESVNLKQYILSKYKDRCTVFGNVYNSKTALKYALYESDQRVSRVINYLN